MFTIANMHVHDCGYACSQTAPIKRRRQKTTPLKDLKLDIGGFTLVRDTSAE